MPGRDALKRYAVLIPLALLLGLWACLIPTLGHFGDGPSGRHLGGDFAILMAGATLVHDGGNPYDARALLHTETVYLQHEGVASGGLPHNDAPTRAMTWTGYPPIVFWALSSVTPVPWTPLAVCWLLAMVASCVVGLYVLTRAWGWSQFLVPCLVFLLLPQTVLGLVAGNINSLVFALLAWGIALMQRRPVIAGLLFSVASIKPHVVLPVLLLLVLFHAPSRLAVVRGWAAGIAGMTAVMLATTGPGSIAAWIGGMLKVSGAHGIGLDLVPLSTLYSNAIAGEPRLALEGVTVLVALALTGVYFVRTGGASNQSFLATGWLWAVWLLAVPFAHVYDEKLYLIPLIALVGRDARGAGHAAPAISLYALFLTLVPLSQYRSGLQTPWVPVVVVAVCLAWTSYRRFHQWAATPAVEQTTQFPTHSSATALS